MPTAKGNTRSSRAWSFPASSRPSSLLLLAALLALPAWGAGAPDPLEEMRLRRIIPRDAVSATPRQRALLARVRAAQARGAFDLIREKLGTLRGFAVQSRGEDGVKRLWLTAEGYRRFYFLLAQEARAYFESRGAEAKIVFRLRSRAGKPLFDEHGMLTRAGVEVYERARRGLPVFWRYPDGRLTGNVRPPKEDAPPAPADAYAPPAAPPEWEADEEGLPEEYGSPPPSEEPEDDEWQAPPMGGAAPVAPPDGPAPEPDPT